jgi:hypothetical protein
MAPGWTCRFSMGAMPTALRGHGRDGAVSSTGDPAETMPTQSRGHGTQLSRGILVLHLEPVQELLRGDARSWADRVVPLGADIVAGQLQGFELGF